MKEGLVFLFSFLAVALVVFGGMVFGVAEVSASSGFVYGNGGIDWKSPVVYVIISLAWMLLLTVILLFVKVDNLNGYKHVYFWAIVVPVVLASVYLAGHTVYGNFNSVTNGPVHWHADYQVRVCGERVDLVNPDFPRNKIGSPLFHEHNDDRIHIEGTVDELANINLERYFETIGGKLAGGEFVFPTEDRGVVSVKDGDECNGNEGSLKVYLNGKILENYEDYVIYPDAYVPPGDCFIVVFDESEAEETEIICESWEVKGWTYEKFESGEVKRRQMTIGDRTWEK